MEKREQEYEDIVIDTTGSVIYLESAILEKLTKLTKVVYFQTPQSVQKKMYELYMNDPKPVIWGDSFRQKKGESPIEALGRCYPELLAFRTKQYEKIADVSLDYQTLRSSTITLDTFMQFITNE